MLTIAAVMLLLPLIEGEFCPAYNDSSGRYKTGFSCPTLFRLFRHQDQYCCGNFTYRNCCYEITHSIFNHTETRVQAYWFEYWPFVAFFGFALVGFMFSPFLT